MRPPERVGVGQGRSGKKPLKQYFKRFTNSVHRPRLPFGIITTPYLTAAISLEQSFVLRYCLQIRLYKLLSREFREQTGSAIVCQHYFYIEQPVIGPKELFEGPDVASAYREVLDSF